MPKRLDCHCCNDCWRKLVSGAALTLATIIRKTARQELNLKFIELCFVVSTMPNAALNRLANLFAERY